MPSDRRPEPNSYIAARRRCAQRSIRRAFDMPLLRRRAALHAHRAPFEALGGGQGSVSQPDPPGVTLTDEQRLVRTADQELGFADKVNVEVCRSPSRHTTAAGFICSFPTAFRASRRKAQTITNRSEDVTRVIVRRHSAAYYGDAKLKKAVKEFLGASRRATK